MHRSARWLAIALVSLSSSAPAFANSWSWSLSGTGLAASGVFTTAGDASSFEAVTGISGVFNGFTIAGLVPLNTDARFGYDNLFTFTGGKPQLDFLGLLLDVTGLGHVNVFDANNDVFDANYFAGPGTQGPQEFFPVTFTTVPLIAAVPEPSTVALMLAGLTSLGIARRRNYYRSA